MKIKFQISLSPNSGFWFEKLSELLELPKLERRYDNRLDSKYFYPIGDDFREKVSLELLKRGFEVSYLSEENKTDLFWSTDFDTLAAIEVNRVLDDVSVKFLDYIIEKLVGL